MDGPRFDRITRLLAGDGDRRQMLRALIVGGGALLLGRDAARGQEAAPCTKDADCPVGTICCAGGVCCEAGPGAPAAPPPGGCQSDADCSAVADPCTTVRCRDGVCSAATVVCAAGSVCCGEGECCPLPCLSDADCPIAENDGCTVARCLEGSCASTPIDCGSDACCGGICLEPCAIGQTYDESCHCVWLDAARPWRRLLRD